ncbi:response regulator [soil metagenome]
MSEASPTRQLTIAVVVPVLLLLVAAALLTLQLTRLTSAANWVDRTDAVIAKTNETQGQIVDQETALRGYLLTQNPSFLEPFEKAHPKLRIEELRALVSDNPAQVERVDELGLRYDQWLASVQEERDAPTGKGSPMDGIRTRKRYMDGIRSEVADIVAVETGLRVERQATLHSAHTLTLAGIFPALIALSLILALVSRRQLGAISDAFKKTLSNERKARAAVETQAWARTQHTKLSQSLLGDLSVHEICALATSQLTEAVGARVGALYLVDGDELELESGYALPEDAPKRLKRGVGLLGAALAKDELVHVRDVPKGYLKITSSTGEVDSGELLILPAYAEGIPRAVIELGFLGKADQRAVDLLPRVSETIASTIRAAQQKLHLRDLLEETQRQAEELQSQQEELAASNEELQGHSDALRGAHAQLEERKDELEATNASLQEQRQELLRLSEALQTKADDLARASQYKSEFVANMSHELRTPLNSSLILAKMLSENKPGNLNADQLEYARTIYGAGNDLLALINDILDLSKVEAGKLELRIAPLSIKALVESLGRTFTPIAKDKNLAFDVAADEGIFDSDVQRIEQVLKNLLANAFKFTEKGRVSLRVEQGPLQIRFVVEDTGIGIARENHEAVFEAFRQADGTTNRRFGGTGLGLSIARDLARLLGGEVSMTSTVGVGSAFSLTLPRAPGIVVTGIGSAVPPPAQRIYTPMAESERVRTPGIADDRALLDGKSPLLLVVEDDLSFALAVKEIAHELGFQCIVATTADDAIDLALAHLTSSVILDMKLPDHSGLSVLDRLKRNPLTRHIPVHVVSAVDHMKTARTLGAIGYAMKPVRKDDLVAAIEGMRQRFSSIRRILVVEDDEVQRDAISLLLRADDVEIVTASSVKEAIDKIRSITFDCVVTDVNLGEESGFDFLDQLAKDDGTFPPVIVYTGRSLSLEEEDRLRRHSSSIIVKGARSPERLVDEVALFLHPVAAHLPPERQRMLADARNRDSTLEGRTILIAEDDVRNVFALTSLLEGKGATVIAARNGKQALEVLERREDIELVLMDVMMHEMDGITATKEIRRREGRFAKLPIIAITAKAMPDDQERCLKAGANDYIPKPLDVEMLLSLVRVWLS